MELLALTQAFLRLEGSDMDPTLSAGVNPKIRRERICFFLKQFEDLNDSVFPLNQSAR